MPVATTNVRNYQFTSPSEISTFPFYYPPIAGVNRFHDPFNNALRYVNQGLSRTGYIIVGENLPTGTFQNIGKSGYYRVRVVFKTVNGSALPDTTARLGLGTNGSFTGLGAFSAITSLSVDGSSTKAYTHGDTETIDVSFYKGVTGVNDIVLLQVDAALYATNDAFHVNEFFIEYTPPVKAFAGLDKTVTGTTFNLDGQSLGGEYNGATYEWTTAAVGVVINNANSLTPTITGATAGNNYIFTLTITDGEGRTSFDSVTVTVDDEAVVEPPVSGCNICFLEATIINEGKDLAILTALSDPLEYSLDGGAFQSSNVFENISNGEHTVEIRVIDAPECPSQTYIINILGLTEVGDDNAFTLSYSMKNEAWASFHDYTPSYMIDFVNTIVSINNDLDNKFYEHNDEASRGKYYAGKVYAAYLEKPFIEDRIKEFYSVNWETELRTLQGVYQYMETFTGALLYNNRYCSDFVDKLAEKAKIEDDVFKFNKFKNTVASSRSALIDAKGKPLLSITNTRGEISQSNIRGKFAIVKLIYDNIIQREMFIKGIEVLSKNDETQRK